MIQKRQRSQHGVSERPSELSFTLTTLRDQRRWLVGSMVLCGLLAAVFALITPDSYSATSEVQVRAVTNDPFDASGSPLDRQLSMPTEAQLARSGTVAQLAITTLGLDQSPRSFLSHVTVVNPVTTQLLRFTYSGASAREAARRADAMADAYLQVRLAAITSSVDTISQSITRQIASNLAQRRQISIRLNASSGSAAASLAVQRDALDSARLILVQRQSSLQTLDTRPGTISGAASLPTNPSGLGLPLTVLLGLVVGLVAGVLAANVRGHLDTRLRSLWQLNDLINPRGSVLIPPMGRRHRSELAVRSDDDSAVSREFRLLASRLRLGGLGSRSHSLAVVTSGSGQGGSTVAANLAFALAEQGLQVVLVDANAWTPVLHTVFGVDRSPGLTDLGPASLQVWQFLGDQPRGAKGSAPGVGVTFVPSGVGAQLGATGVLVLREIVADGRHPGTVVVVDGGAVLDSSDSLLVLDEVEGVVLVAAQTLTTADDVTRVVKLLDDADVTLVAGVLTPVDSRRISRRTSTPTPTADRAASADERRDILPTRTPPSTAARPLGSRPD